MEIQHLHAIILHYQLSRICLLYYSYNQFATEKSPPVFHHKPGNGYWIVKASTLLCRSSTLSIKGNSGEVTNFMKSWSLEPETKFLASRVICTPSLIRSATVTNSFSEKPRVVIAGEPMRIPPGTSALLSPKV